MYRRRLSFAESDGDINSCSDIQTLNAGDEMNFGLNNSRESSLVSGDVVTVDDPSPRNEEPDHLGRAPGVGFTSDETPIWPDLSSQEADEFPPLAAAQANEPDQFPALMRSTTSPTAEENEHDEEHARNETRQHMYPSRVSRHFSRSPPRTIMIGRDRSRSRHRSQSKRAGPRSSKLHDDETATISMWNTKLCGMRADRLIVLLAMILFFAVAIIVGALIYSNRMVSNSSQASANTADEISLTRTPVASPVLSPTMDGIPAAPVVAAGSTEETFAPTPIPTTISPSIFVTEVPSPTPTLAPQKFPTTIAPTTWPKKLCGADDESAEFPIEENVYVNCTMVAASPDKATVCAAGSPAHFFCRETCENCEPDTPWPAQVCGVDSPVAQVYAGPGVGTHSCEWVRQMYGGHGKRLCDRRELTYHACRETCRNCGPFGVWPTSIPTAAPVVAATPTNPQIASPTLQTSTPIASPTLPPTRFVATDFPTTQMMTESPTFVSTTLVPTIQVSNGEDAIPDMRSIVINAFPASAVRLSREMSPQSVAIRWMERAFEDGAYLGLSNDRLLQIFALASIAYSTNVAQWNNRQNWLMPSVNECQWFGITCGGQTVIAIDLPSNGLSGPFPPEISLLQDSLRILILSSNSLGGIVSAAIGNLYNLEELRIDRNDFTGILPSSIGRLRSLRLFYLEHNPSIRGAFPSSVLEMSSLEELVFYYTSISSIPSDICALELPTLIYDCKQITFPTCWTRCFYLCGGNTGIIC